MAKSDKVWHPDFLEYMEWIVSHPHYSGLPIKRKNDGSLAWIATAQSDIGKARIAWCENKAKELGFPIEAGVYARVMREIHPTKWKVCQTCGRKMSIYYHYPSVNCIKAIKKQFGIEYTEIDHISDVWDNLIDNGFSNSVIADFFIRYGGLTGVSKLSSKDNIIDALEKVCRTEGKSILSPGAMSNFPDRYDGFHTYNRCCRSTQDKGRSKENLKSYTQDRRAYEYWSDGNIHAANQFMGSKFFAGISADHVGPISLGFVHDPRYLQPMSGSDNSSKRDRLQRVDIESIIRIEKRTGVYPMSWFSKEIWEHIRSNYAIFPKKIATLYRDALKQNMSNFMFVLWYILENAKDGQAFLISTLLKPNYHYFENSYSFNEKGDIISCDNRHYTERNAHEMERYTRVAIEAVYDFNSKDNRNIRNNLTANEISDLKRLCSLISQHSPEAKTALKVLMIRIQKRIISEL